MPPSPDSESTIRRVLLFLFMALLVFRIGAGVVRNSFLLPLSTDVSFPEGALVARAADAAMGRSPYIDWREWPHQFAPYGPLTYYPTGWLARIAAEAPSMDRIYFVGRLQSLISFLGILALIVGFARRLGADWVWVLFGAAFFCSWTKLMEFISSYRPDAPQTLLALLGLAVAMNGPPKAMRAAAAFALLWVSFWFKPTAWGVLAALGYWSARGAGLRFSALGLTIFAVTGLAAAWLLDRALGGMLFLNMIGSLDNGWQISNVARFFIRTPIGPMVVLFGGAVASLIYYRDWAGERRGEGSRVFAVAVLASFLLSTVQYAKVGSDVNYYLGAFALSSAALAGALSRLWKREIGFSPITRAVALAAVILPVVLYDASANLANLAGDLRVLRSSWGNPLFAPIAREIDGPILTTNPYMALIKPAPPTILDHIHYQVLVERGALDPEMLHERIRTRYFSAVLLPTKDLEMDRVQIVNAPGPYTQNFKNILNEHYEITRVVGPISIFTPRRR